MFNEFFEHLKVLFYIVQLVHRFSYGRESLDDNPRSVHSIAIITRQNIGAVINTRARRIELDPGPEVLDRMNFNYNLIIKKIITKITSEMYQTRYYRYRLAEKKKFLLPERLPDVNIKNILLENIKSVIKMRVRVRIRKILDPTGSSKY